MGETAKDFKGEKKRGGVLFLKYASTFQTKRGKKEREMVEVEAYFKQKIQKEGGLNPGEKGKKRFYSALKDSEKRKGKKRIFLSDIPFEGGKKNNMMKKKKKGNSFAHTCKMLGRGGGKKEENRNFAVEKKKRKSNDVRGGGEKAWKMQSFSFKKEKKNFFILLNCGRIKRENRKGRKKVLLRNKS